MAWKPKEKPLTAEEAVELARKELAPYWFGSSPVLAAVASGKIATAHPIDPSFAKKSWLFFFTDPTSFGGRAILRCADEWHRRYNSHDLEMVVVFSNPYEVLRKTEIIQTEKERNSWPMTLVLDHDGLLSRAFGATGASLPKVILIHGGKTILDQAGREWFEGTELKIQKLLRLSDPGLPLFPPLNLSAESTRDQNRIDFGITEDFPSPGFSALPTGHFVAKFPEAGAQGKGFTIGGTWVREGDRIVTADPKAFLSFKCGGPDLAIIAQSVKARALVQVEAGNQPVIEEICDTELFLNETGQAIATLAEPRVYPILARLPSDRREVTLRFPQAAQEPVALYGVRCGTHG